MNNQLFVGVPKAEAETWRRRLIAHHTLVRGIRAQGERDLVHFPVHNGDYLKKIVKEGLGISLREVEPDTNFDIEAVRKLLPRELRHHMVRAHDRIGELLVLRLPEELAPYEAILAEGLMKAHKVRTVALDRGVSGPYRIRRLRVIGGDTSLVTEHREYGLRYRMDLGEVYFSPRLATERNRIATATRPHEQVVDMFAGVGPFAIALARRGGAHRVVACDINPGAIHWLQTNCRLNRVEGIVEPRQGDVNDTLVERDWADRVVLNHPTAPTKFIELAVKVARPGATLHLYTLTDAGELEALTRRIENLVFDLGHPRPKVRCHQVHGFSTTREMWAFWIGPL